jgi:hypothetical protein
MPLCERPYAGGGAISEELVLRQILESQCIVSSLHEFTESSKGPMEQEAFFFVCPLASPQVVVGSPDIIWQALRIWQGFYHTI